MSDLSEYLSPTILDSRRLFGPNVFGSQAGAVLDVQRDSDAVRRAADGWPDAVRQLAAALQWPPVFTRRHDSSAMTSLFLTAPLDGLLTATDLSEHAWVMAEADAVQPPDQSVALLRAQYTAESTRAHYAPVAAALAQQWARNFSLDDESCAIGGGAGVFVHRFDAPDGQRADASRVFDVPTVLVTGSNGKTTTTRLVAAMWRAAGRRAGWCCSDGVYINGDQTESGDYTGPGGARCVLNDVRVEAAVLETARGGMLRRGLALTRADGAIITNISDDHFGEYGVSSLRDLAHAKRTVVRALRPGAVLVLNADDVTLRELGDDIADALAHDSIAIAWFSATDTVRHAMRGEPAPTKYAAVVRDEQLLLHTAGTWHALGDVRAMPLTLRGGARHNVANIAGAALLACVGGVPLDAIREALRTFGAEPGDNPGRLMLREFGGVTVVMDYAHNPDGIASLCRTAAAMPATRRLLLLGQAGNRDDAQMQALAGSAWQTQAFDRVLLKDMTAMLRGRAPGEVPQMLRAALIEAGAPAHALEIVPSELEGVRAALRWAREGDLLVLGVHVERARVLALMNALGASSWKPGAPLPAP